MTDYTKLGTENSAATVGYDAGLRSFLLKVYNYMTVALIVSGAVAFAAGNSEGFLNFVAQNRAMIYVIIFAPLAVVLIFSARLNSMSVQSAQGVFWLFAVLNGLSMSFIFAVYARQSIYETFFITAATFGAMSLYGYTTKRNLTGMGHFMIMGLFGIIIASIINIFLGSAAIQFAISLIGVAVFIGLTAYDTQKLKDDYYIAGGNSVMASKSAIVGALNLYLDFINLFILLLRLTGSRR